MKKIPLIAALIFAATSCFAGVTLSSPANGSTVASSVHFVASASGAANISAIIVYVDGNEVARSYASTLDQYATLGTGGHSAVTKAWDDFGNVYSTNTSFTVSSSTTTTTSTGSLTINISSPAAGATLSSPVHLLASASGASRMSAYIDGVDVWDTTSGSLDGWKSVATGGHTITFKAWDSSGNVSSNSVSITVGTSTTTTTTTTGSLTINVSSPAAGATLSSPVHLLASASGASRMSAYLDGTDVWDSTGGTLDGWKSVGSGSHTVQYKAWDSSGNVSSTSVSFSIGTATSGGGSTTTTTSSGTTRYNMQNLSGWNSCSACAGAGGNGPVASYYMSQFESSPSLTGSSTKFAITGGPSYADVLWYHSVVPSSADPSINKNTSHFIYDTYFYINNGSVAQALEFDVNQYVNGAQLIWGTQCNIRGGNHWDIYDNRNWRWVSTGIYCPTPSSNTWHHVILEVERDTSDNWLHYISITLDGTTHYLDAWYGPTTSSWNVSTINFQMDLDGAGDPYAVWLDKLNVTYW